MMAEQSSFQVWHARIDVDAVVAAAPTGQTRAVVKKTVARARQHNSLQGLSKLTTVRDGRRVIVEDPPLIVRLGDEEVEQAFRFARAYRSTLEPDRRLLFDRRHRGMGDLRLGPARPRRPRLPDRRRQ
jgi:hypothetical protein